VFGVDYLLKLFSGRYQVDSFSYVNDRGDLHENAELTPEKAAKSFDCSYGCGIFEMTKLI
jgi:hypothetical protein